MLVHHRVTEVTRKRQMPEAGLDRISIFGQPGHLIFRLLLISFKKKENPLKSKIVSANGIFFSIVMTEACFCYRNESFIVEVYAVHSSPELRISYDTSCN